MLLSTYGQYVKTGGMLDLRRFLDCPVAWKEWPCDLRRYRYERLVGYYHKLFGRERVLALTYEELKTDPAAFVRAVVDFGGAKPQPGVLERLQVAGHVNESYPGRRCRQALGELARPREPESLGGIRRRRAGRIGDERGRPSFREQGASIDERASRTGDALDSRRRGGDYYRESNARTSELTGLELAKYGYDVEPDPRPTVAEVPVVTAVEAPS